MKDATRAQAIQWCKLKRCDFDTPVFPPPNGWAWAESGTRLCLSPIFTITDQGEEITLEEVQRAQQDSPVVAGLLTLIESYTAKAGGEAPGWVSADIVTKELLALLEASVCGTCGVLIQADTMTGTACACSARSPDQLAGHSLPRATANTGALVALALVSDQVVGRVQCVEGVPDSAFGELNSAGRALPEHSPLYARPADNQLRYVRGPSRKAAKYHEEWPEIEGGPVFDGVTYCNDLFAALKRYNVIVAETLPVGEGDD